MLELPGILYIDLDNLGHIARALYIERNMSKRDKNLPFNNYCYMKNPVISLSLTTEYNLVLNHETRN
jgi:hypothetical protein